MVRSVPVCDESGQVVRRFGTATDIDDRMRAEEATRAGEQRFRFLAESIPQMVWTARPDGFVDYASPRSLEFLGVAPDQVLGWTWIDLLHPDDRERTIEAWEQALREGTEYRIEYRFRNGATGEFRWFLAQALPQRDEAGLVVGWYGTCTDIDAQWRTRQEIVRLNRDLRARVDELETIFATVPIGIAISKDVACTGMRSNPALERILEIAPGSNTSQSAPAGERPENFATYRDGRKLPPQDLPMQVAARTGQPVTGAEEEVRFADGRIKRLYGTASPLFDEDGQPRGAVGAFLDMTEWRRVEAALKDNEEHLRLAIQATDLGLFDRDLTTNILAMVRSLARRSSASRRMPRSPSTSSTGGCTRRIASGSASPSSTPWTPPATASTRPITGASGMTAPCAGWPPRDGSLSKSATANGGRSGSSAPCKTSRPARTPRHN